MAWAPATHLAVDRYCRPTLCCAIPGLHVVAAAGIVLVECEIAAQIVTMIAAAIVLAIVAALSALAAASVAVVPAVVAAASDAAATVAGDVADSAAVAADADTDAFEFDSVGVEKSVIFLPVDYVQVAAPVGAYLVAMTL